MAQVLGFVNASGDRVSVSADNPLPVSGGGGGGGASGEVSVQNWPATQPVSGPLTNAQLTAVTGTAAVAAWAGAGNGTEIAILKAIWAQNEDIKALLTSIAANTASAP